MVTAATPSTETLIQSSTEPPVASPESLVAAAPQEPPPAAQTPAAQVAIPEAQPVVRAPAVQTEEQAYISRLEQQAQSGREQAELQTLNQVVAQYAQQLEEQQGLTPEQAQNVARTQGNILYGQYQAQQTSRGQVRAAIAIAKEFGVDPLQLIDLTSPQTMQQTAQNLSAASKQSQEIAQLRAQIDKLTKAGVPAQSFAQGAQPGTGAGLQGDALEAAWLKHEIEQSDKPNPYDAGYRAMLRR